MEKVFSPLIRQFSAIEGLQTPYTLVYSMDSDSASGCRLTLCRTGEKPRMESLRLAAAPERAYNILRYLCENVVQPEVWGDVVSEILPQSAAGEKGVVRGEQ